MMHSIEDKKISRSRIDGDDVDDQILWTRSRKLQNPYLEFFDWFIRVAFVCFRTDIQKSGVIFFLFRKSCSPLRVGNMVSPRQQPRLTPMELPINSVAWYAEVKGKQQLVQSTPISNRDDAIQLQHCSATRYLFLPPLLVHFRQYSSSTIFMVLLSLLFHRQAHDAYDYVFFLPYLFWNYYSYYYAFSTRTDET